MATFTEILLSGSTNGLPIPVAATATPGTLIHTAVTGTSAIDEVYIYASNVTSAAATLTIEFGGVTDPANHIVKALSVPANSSRVLVVQGSPINNALVVRAFSGTASAINITGYVNRIQ